MNKFTVRYEEHGKWIEKTVEAHGFRLECSNVIFYEEHNVTKTDIHAFVNVVSVIREG
jgi:hypothetical protein